MKLTLANRSDPKAINRTAASWGSALILAAILLGIAAVAARADCNPADRIDASCYPDLQGAAAAALVFALTKSVPWM